MSLCHGIFLYLFFFGGWRKRRLFGNDNCSKLYPILVEHRRHIHTHDIWPSSSTYYYVRSLKVIGGRRIIRC